jgi:hypothetical protein
MFEYIEDVMLKPARPYVRRKATDCIVLHHFASDATPEAVHAYHIGRGHRGIDYNIVVLLNGRAVWGRGLEYEGGHVLNEGATAGMNARSIGIACQGNFDERAMPAAQKVMLMRVIWDCLRAYPGIKSIVGHREVAATACPGKNFPLAEAKSRSGGNMDAKKAVGRARVRAFLYARPDKGGKVLRTFKQGDAMDVLDTAGCFYRAEAGGAAGYVSGNRVVIESGSIAAPAPVFTLARFLKRESPYVRGNDVLAVQRELYESGFDPQGLDGIYGPKTAEAVRRFQRSEGLKTDRIVGERTARALGAKWAGPA